MSQRSEKLKILMRREVAYKSPSSAISFALVATFIFFYGFELTKYLTLVRTFCVIIVIVSVLRFLHAKYVKKTTSITHCQWLQLKVLIWLNTICWSAVINFATYELNFQGVPFILVTTILTGFVAASLVTLAYDKKLFIPFQVMLLLPQSILIVHHCLMVGNAYLLPILPAYIVFFLYQMKQARVFYDQLKERFNYELDLIESNQKLTESREALLNQNTKLIHTSRLAALGEMSAGIAHEVNNPLAIISGSLQQLEKQLQKGNFDREKVSNLAQKSLHSVDRITKIVGGLKHFSRQSDDNPKITLNISVVMEDTLNFCLDILEARHIKMIIDKIPDIKVTCHPVQISQVLINLLKNSEDALLEEKNPDERWIKISFEENEEFFFIVVSNGGARIPKEMEQKLFEPFFTTKGSGKGTGLGLSISRGIMSDHGGNLIYDEEASHTTFKLFLPKKIGRHS